MSAFFEHVPLATLCHYTHLLPFYVHMPFPYCSSMLVQLHDVASITQVFLRSYDSVIVLSSNHWFYLQHVQAIHCMGPSYQVCRILFAFLMVLVK